MKRMIYVILLAAVVAGCAGLSSESNEYWMNDNGYGQATTSDLIACKYETAKAGGGYDWIDASIRRVEVMHLCMRTRGYVPRGW